MQNEVLNRLDQIESLAPGISSGAAHEAAELLAAFGREPRQLQLLIERYGGTQSAALANGLALVVSASAGVSPPPIFALLEKLRRKDTAEVLMNCLSGILNLLHAPVSWRPAGPAPPALFPFLRHCLNYARRLDSLVVPDALAVIFAFDTLGIIGKSFSPLQLTWLRQKLTNLRLLKRDWLGERLSELEGFLNRQDIFLERPPLNAVGAAAGRLRAGELTKTFAGGIEELWILVERYGDSADPALRRALAELLTNGGPSQGPELLELGFYFSEKVRGAADAELALACLECLRRLIHSAPLWIPTAQPSSAPYPFLLYCLTLSQTHRDGDRVAGGVLRLLAVLARKGALTEVFSRPQITVLRDRLKALGLPPLGDDAELIRRFIDEDDIFLRPSLTARLDEIERAGRESSTGIDEESLELVESFAWEPAEVGLLVERYGGSSNIALVNALALILFKRCESPRKEMLPVIFSFLKRLQRNEAPVAGAYCLMALRQQLLSKIPFRPSRADGRLLYALLTYSLDGDDPFARTAALKLILTIHEEGVQEKLFTPDRLASLSHRVRELASTGDSSLHRLAAETLIFLEEPLP